MNHRKTHIILILFLAITCICRGQAYFRFNHITTEQGLPHMQVNALMEDTMGCLWIGTRGGLCKYDGYEMKVYRHSDAKSSLCHDFCRSIFQDRSGRIWIGTMWGICRLSDDQQTFVTYPEEHSIQHFAQGKDGTIYAHNFSHIYAYDELQDAFTTLPISLTERIADIVVSSSGLLYFMEGNELHCYNPSTQTVTQKFSLFKSKNNGEINSNNICPLFIDSQNRLWISVSGQGVACLDSSLQVLRQWPAQALSDVVVRVFAEDVDSNIWLGTEKGITIIPASLEGDLQFVQHSFYSSSSLNHNAVYAILQDKNHSMWVGTFAGGLDVVNYQSLPFHYISPGATSKNLNGKVISIMQQVGDELWIASEDGGLNIYNRTTGKIRLFNLLPAHVHNIHALYYDASRRQMWIGTFLNGLYRYDLSNGSLVHYNIADGLPSDGVFCISCLPDGRIVVGTLQGLRTYHRQSDRFIPLDSESMILNRLFIVTILADNNGNLWAGTTNGLYRYNLTDGSVEQWARQSEIGDNNITALFLDSKERIFVGTNNNGLHYMSSHHGLPMKVDVPCNMIASVIEDDNGLLWVGTSQGIYSVNLDTEQISHYSQQNGLPVNQMEFSSCFKDEKGVVYFGSVNGLIFFRPNDIDPVVRPLKVYITHYEVEENTLTVDYLATSLTLARNITYQFKIDDKPWVSMGSLHHLVLPNLDIGKHTLQLRAYIGSERGVLHTTTLPFHIRPAWYARWWAWLLYAVLATGLVVLIYRFSLRRTKEKMRLEFFNSVAHELTTPLSLILAPLQQLLEQTKGGNQQDIRMALRNTERMRALIEELTLYNRTETGQMQLLLQRDNPMLFLREVTNLFTPAFREKNQQFFVQLEDNGEEVWFAPHWVEIIVTNLVSNAHKYTPEGGTIRFMANIFSHPDNVRYLQIKVEDTGIGITKDEMAHIFDKYYQTPRGHLMDSEGWGLGLVLTRALVEKHKGWITCVSHPDEGTCFTAILCVSCHSFRPEELLPIDRAQDVVQNYSFQKPIWTSRMSEAEQSREFLQALEQLVERNIANDHFSVADITKALGVSRSVLHVKAKNLLGIPVFDYVKRKRIMTAQQLLMEGLSVSEVCYQTGFTDPSYFTKCFKKETGMNPTEYKKNKK